MRERNASMYVGSRRMAEMVIGEKVTLEEMGGARLHTGVSGCGHQLVAGDEEGIQQARRYLPYLPSSWEHEPPPSPPAPPRALRGGGARGDRIPGVYNRPSAMVTLIDAIVDEGSLRKII